MKATLEQWRMFCAVVEHGGFSQAAQAIHKSQSTIHHAVQKLELQLGLPLLQVQGRKAQLTAAGEVMLRKAQLLLAEASKTEDVAHSLAAGIEAKLTIAVDEAFPQTPLYQVLEQVSNEYPLLRIELVETVLSGANEVLQQGKVDIALSPLTLTNCINEEICRVPFILVSSPQHPLQQPAELSFDQLKVYRQIVVRDSAVMRKQDAGWLGAEQRWTVSHLHSSIALVEQNLGFAWLPQPAIAAALAQQRLQPLALLSGGERHVQFYMNFIDGDRLGPAARSFLAYLRLQTFDNYE